MKYRMKTLGMLLASGLCYSGHASLITLDFDALAPGNYGEAVFNSQFTGVSFHNTGMGGFSVTNTLPGGDFTGPNVILNNPYTTAGNATVATFSAAVDFVSVTLGDYGSDADLLTLNAYDASDNLLASDVFNIPSSFVGGHTLSVSSAGIHHVSFFGVGVANNSVYWDNFAYNTSDTPAVPEPGTLALVGMGCLALGLFAKRRTAPSPTP